MQPAANMISLFFRYVRKNPTLKKLPHPEKTDIQSDCTLMHFGIVEMKLLDLPDDVLNSILNHYVQSITFKDWANRPVVDPRPWDLFCKACELLLP